MDHLGLPQHPKHLPILIPYLSTDPYDGGDFETYPERKGWTTVDIEGSSGCTKALDERAAFLQTWLFFGLLRTVLGDGFEEQDYILKRPSESSVITLSKVQDRLSRLPSGKARDISEIVPLDLPESLLEAVGLQRAHQLPEALAQDDMVDEDDAVSDDDDSARIAIALNCAHDFNIRILRFGPYNHDLDLVCLSVAALGELLSLHFGIQDDNMWLRSSNNNFLFQSMIQDGWCPVEIIRLGKMLTTGQLYYLSNMARPGLDKSHDDCVKRIPLGEEIAEGIFARSPDDRLICTAYQMNWQTYRTKHIQGCRPCDELFANQALMTDILEKGFFPLLIPASRLGHAEGCDDEKVGLPKELKMVSSEVHSKYVCISHVWSDGLGNPHANSIPQCQYQRLSTLVRELYPNEDIPFWIDTISVPRAPVETRRQAIMLMRKTYWDADSILVLDSYLLDVDLQKTPEHEVWLRLLSCGWTRRLWTLQESAVAKEIFLQFSDGFLDIDQCLGYAAHTNNDTLILEWTKLRGAWERWASDLKDWKQQLLNTLSDAVAWRATSIAEDEAICLGNITGLEPAAIEQILLLTTHEERMVKFWTLQPTLFTGVLFWGGPRIPTSPYRWAPLSFLNQGPAGFLSSQTNQFSPAQVCDDGLRFRLPGLRLGRWRKRFRPTVFLRTDVHAWYRLASDMDRIPAPVSADDDDDDEEEKTSLAVIFQESSAPSFIDALPPGASMAALIVSIRQSVGSESTTKTTPCIYATPVCLATMQRTDDRATTTAWVDPLEELVARFYRIAQPDKFPPRARRIQLSGSALGHRNAGSATDSDITATWVDGRLGLDLEERHVMFEATTLLPDQEWCVG